MLKKLANAVTKRPKTIVLIWVIALVLSLPLAGMVNDALKYDDTQMGTDHP